MTAQEKYKEIQRLKRLIKGIEYRNAELWEIMSLEELHADQSYQEMLAFISQIDKLKS